MTRYLEEAEKLATALGDRRRLAWVWTYMTIAHLFAGDPAQALATGARVETWALPGSFALLAALIALSPPTPWWRFHALRMAAYVLCWLPVILSELGLHVTVALAPVVLLASVSSTGDLPVPVSGSRLEARRFVAGNRPQAPSPKPRAGGAERATIWRPQPIPEVVS